MTTPELPKVQDGDVDGDVDQREEFQFVELKAWKSSRMNLIGQRFTNAAKAAPRRRKSSASTLLNFVRGEASAPREIVTTTRGSRRRGF